MAVIGDDRSGPNKYFRTDLSFICDVRSTLNSTIVSDDDISADMSKRSYYCANSNRLGCYMTRPPSDCAAG
jgi:hypothetical protein